MQEGLISQVHKQGTTPEVRKTATIRGLIKEMEGEIAKALPSVLTPERFTRITLSALSTNQKLAECTPASFLGAMMTAAQLGVEPNTAWTGLSNPVPEQRYT